MRGGVRSDGPVRRDRRPTWFGCAGQTSAGLALLPPCLFPQICQQRPQPFVWKPRFARASPPCGFELTRRSSGDLVSRSGQLPALCGPDRVKQLAAGRGQIVGFALQLLDARMLPAALTIGLLDMQLPQLPDSVQQQRAFLQREHFNPRLSDLYLSLRMRKTQVPSLRGHFPKGSKMSHPYLEPADTGK